MKGEEQRIAANEQMARLLESQRLLSAFDTEGHKWSSEAIDTEFDEASQEAVSATSQIDISQVLSDIVMDATSQFSASEQSQSSRDIRESLLSSPSLSAQSEQNQSVKIGQKPRSRVRAAAPEKPTEPRRSARFEKRNEPSSPVDAFNSPTRADYDEFIRIAESVAPAMAEPFALDDGRARKVQQDQPGPRAAPMLPLDRLADMQAGQDVTTAVSEFTIEMTRFAEAVTASIQTLTRRLNSLSRVLESEGHDIR